MITLKNKIMNISNFRFLVIICLSLTSFCGFSSEINRNKPYSNYREAYSAWISKFLNDNTTARGVVVNEENYLYGIIDKSGKEIVPCIYDYISDFEDGMARVQKMYYSGFINEKGEEIIPCDYTYCSSFIDGMSLVCKNRKFGFIDQKGKEIIPIIYDYLESFEEGNCIYRKDGKYGFLNKNGESVIPASFEEALSFQEGLAAAKIDNKWGFIDKSGNFVIPNKYSHVTSFCEGWAVVSQQGKQFYIDKSGKCVLEFNAKYLTPFYNGLAIVIDCDIDSPDLNFGIINKKGEILIPLKYAYISPKEEYYMLWGKDGLRGLVNDKGKIILPCEYSHLSISGLTNGLFIIYNDGKYGYLSLNGEMQLSFKYKRAEPFYENRAAVITTETENNASPWVFIDKNGKIFTKGYENVKNFSEGLAAVKKNSQWGFINELGKTIISPRYDDVEEFHDGLACVKIDGKWSFINKKGVIFPGKYDYPANFKNGFAIIRKLSR